jgi:putative transposase
LARDRRRYLHWVFQAKKRFGLCVLNYMVTSNHIHLLVKDTGAFTVIISLATIFPLVAVAVITDHQRLKESGNNTVRF